MRKLASIQKIVSLSPIEGADKIELATVLGWHVVVAKAEGFRVGDLVVYLEVDSLVPERPEFEFLRKNKFRIKTIRLRGQVSQGLVLPLSILPYAPYDEGDDVTDILGITKYDPEAGVEDSETASERSIIEKFLMRFSWYRKLVKSQMGKGWPEFLPHTDETRIQNFPDICSGYKDVPFVVTEKIDGQSASYFLKRTGNPFKPFVFGVCSRKVYLKTDNGSNYWKVAHKYGIEKLLRKKIGKNKWVAIQGEVFGKGIQGNKYGKEDIHFALFNVLSSSGDFQVNTFDIPHVPTLFPIWYLPETIDDAVQEATGESSLAATPREGLVVRNYKMGISFKIINPEFLLKHGI